MFLNTAVALWGDGRQDASFSGLEPASLATRIGTAEAVPFQKRFMIWPKVSVFWI